MSYLRNPLKNGRLSRRDWSYANLFSSNNIFVVFEYSYKDRSKLFMAVKPSLEWFDGEGLLW